MTYRMLAEKIAALTEEQKDSPVAFVSMGDVVNEVALELSVMEDGDFPGTVLGNPYLICEVKENV